jgi:hypothetical protein
VQPTDPNAQLTDPSALLTDPSAQLTDTSAQPRDPNPQLTEKDILELNIWGTTHSRKCFYQTKKLLRFLFICQKK